MENLYFIVLLVTVISMNFISFILHLLRFVLIVKTQEASKEELPISCQLYNDFVTNIIL